MKEQSLKQATKLLFFAASVCIMTLVAATSSAAVKLESPVVIVKQEDGEGIINITNQLDEPILLHSEIVNVPEDQEDLLIITPPITRMEARDTQMIRFILKESDSLKTERLKRATFEGIHQTNSNAVALSIRQNIPVIIRPAGLPKNNEPWKLLKWSNSAEGLVVENTGPYIVRLAPEVTAEPGRVALLFSKTYILPGEKITLTSQALLNAVEKISFNPASIYGSILETRNVVVH